MNEIGANLTVGGSTTVDAPSVERSTLRLVADNALKAAARFWFVTAVIGQWIFVYYVAFFYGGTALRGDFDAWSKVLPHGIVAGDAAGNVALIVHLVLAVIIIGGGPLQLIPQIRTRVPAFHRWNGRVYVLAAFAASLAGLYMVWTRGTVGGPVLRAAITLDAILILAFGAIAVRHAMTRRFRTHRRWALRLFMVVSAVWFFRVGLMFWVVVNGGPAGFDPETFRGPFVDLWSFGQYLLPLAILELYLYARDRAGALGRFAMSAGLVVMTVAMGVGVFVATMGMWLPRL